MGRILCLILITLGVVRAQAARHLQVSLKGGAGLLCQQEAKSAFWSCEGQRLLFVGETLVGQAPTLHSLQRPEVRVPARIFDLEANRELYLNPQNFQYQAPGASAQESYYRKHNLMMSFEPRLRSCTLTDCQKLRQVLNPILSRQEISAAQKEALETGLLKQADALTSFSGGQAKSEAEMRAAFSLVRADSSLRYDYLRDGCYARAELVASDLAFQGFEVFKIWVHGFSLWDFRVEKPADFFGWRYHVAPVVRVEGRLWVFDPGLFAEPVAASQWVHEVFGPNQKAVVLSEFSEEKLAAQSLVAVSLSPWSMYPGYEASGAPVSAQESAVNLEEARLILEELGQENYRPVK